MGKTVLDLKKLQSELFERRRREAYLVGSAHNDERIAKLAKVHVAIAAIDAVIAEGQDEPASDATAMIL